MFRGYINLLANHANLIAGETVLPMMMTQVDKVCDQKGVELGSPCKALGLDTLIA